MAKMNVTIEVKTQPDKILELYQTLEAILHTMHKDKGCLSHRISRDVEEDEIFFLSSEWDAQDSFEDFIRSVCGSALLAAIDLLGESARIRFDGKDQWEEIETLKRMKRDRGRRSKRKTNKEASRQALTDCIKKI